MWTDELGDLRVKSAHRTLLVSVLAGLLAFPALAEITPAEERSIAQWILRRGGQVMVDGLEKPISNPFDLPARDFRIVVVDMHGTITEPKELEPLNKLLGLRDRAVDRKSTRLNSSHSQISYAVFCLKKKRSKYHTSELQS